LFPRNLHSFSSRLSAAAGVTDSGYSSLLFSKTAPARFISSIAAADVASRKLNSAAAIENHVRVQAELPGIEHAVFDAVIQCQAHQVDVFDPALL